MAKQIDKQPEQVFEDILAAAANMPGVRIDRDAFLKRSLRKHFGYSTVKKAIEKNPAAAGISPEAIKRIAKESINYETGKVTAISTAAGIPGGFAMIGTVPADLAQYFAHVLRITQKLAYLYSWPSLFDENGEMDDQTKSLLTLFIGIMFGAQAANEGIAKIAAKVAANLEKKLPQQALTKGFIYPIVKKVASYLGVKLTKDTFAKGVGKIVPVVGGVVSGGLTLATFRPMCAKLRNYLADLPLADPKTYQEVADDVEQHVEDTVEIEAEILDVSDVIAEEETAIEVDVESIVESDTETK